MKPYFWLKLPIAVIFILSATGKALSFAETSAEIVLLAGRFISIPEWTGSMAAVILLGFELVIALALLFGWQEKVTLINLVLLSLFFLAVNIFKVISSDDKDCGCFGDLFGMSVYVSLLLDCLLILCGSFLLQNIKIAKRSED